LAWTLNTDGLDAKNPTQPFGVHDVQIDVTIVSRQVGPLLANGTARYQWVGCFQDTILGRNLATQVNSAAQQLTNTNEQCQSLCYSSGYALAGTEYQKECWCGNSVTYPQSFNNASQTPCTFSCSGITTEACGGDGGYMSVSSFWSFFVPLSVVLGVLIHGPGGSEQRMTPGPYLRTRF
jgi:iron transport multicopper oxidase